MTSLNPERNSSEGLEEVVGEITVRETDNTSNSLIQLMKKNALSFVIGCLSGAVTYAMVDGKTSNYNLVSGSFLLPTGAIYLTNGIARQPSFEIPGTIFGMLIGSMLVQYCLK